MKKSSKVAILVVTSALCGVSSAQVFDPQLTSIVQTPVNQTAPGYAIKVSEPIIKHGVSYSERLARTNEGSNNLFGISTMYLELKFVHYGSRPTGTHRLYVARAGQVAQKSIVEYAPTPSNNSWISSSRLFSSAYGVEFSQTVANSGSRFGPHQTDILEYAPPMFRSAPYIVDVADGAWVLASPGVWKYSVKFNIGIVYELLTSMQVDPGGPAFSFASLGCEMEWRVVSLGPKQFTADFPLPL